MSRIRFHRDFPFAALLGALATIGMAAEVIDLASGPSQRLLAPLVMLIAGAVGACILLLRLEKPSAAHPVHAARSPALGEIPAALLLVAPVLAFAATVWLYWPEVAIARAQWAMRNHDFLKVQAVLEDSAPARLPPPRAFVRAHLKGQAHLQQFDICGGDDAMLMTGLAAYQEALRIYPDNTPALGEFANLLDDLGDHADALRVHDRRVAVSRGYAGLLGRGASHRALGEYDAALADEDAAVKMAGKQANMPTHYHRGRTLFAMGRYADADAEFLRGLQAQSNYPWVYLYMGCGGAHMGKFDQAIEDYTRGMTEFDKEPLPAVKAAPGAVKDRARMDVELAIIKRQAKGEAVPAEEIDGLCRNFRPEFPHRGRSPLLPAQLDLGNLAEDED